MKRVVLGAGHVYQYIPDKYLIEQPECVFRSVSDLKKGLRVPFDSSTNAVTTANRMGIGVKDVLRRWDISKDIGTSWGSMVDAIFMASLEDIDYKELVRPIPVMTEIACMALEYYADHIAIYGASKAYGQCVVGGEIGTDKYGQSFGIAGTSDVFLVGKDWFRVIDVKSDGAIMRHGQKGANPGYAVLGEYNGMPSQVLTKGISLKNDYGKSLIGIYDVDGNAIDDCDLNIYSFQITLYALLATKFKGFWHGDEWVSLEGKVYQGGAIAHYDGRDGLFHHIPVRREHWWSPVGEYVKKWKSIQ